MKLLSFFILFATITSCSNKIHSQQSVNNVNDFDVLLASLLDENKQRFTYIDSHGNEKYDELKEFKALESIYIKNSINDENKGNLSERQLKVMMFYSFYSQEKKSAAFQEYLASDLMPIYLNNKVKFLKLLKRLPFLIQANCNRLNAFFGFEGKNQQEKPQFLKDNKSLFSKYLNKKQLEICLSNFI